MMARKLMLLGEIGVGKSSLARRLAFNKFDIDYKPTIGVDVYRYEVAATAQRPAVSLIIWDTDGNFGDTIFKHIYMKQAAAALIVGDIMRPPSLETMTKLAEGFAEAFPGRHVGFVVNKSDLVEEPKAEQLPGALTQAGCSLIHTSAKTGHHVQEAFIDAADCIARRGL